MEHTQLTLDKIWHAVLPYPKDCQYVGLIKTDGEGWVIWYYDENSFATQEAFFPSHCIHHSPVLQTIFVQITITLCKSSTTLQQRWKGFGATNIYWRLCPIPLAKSQTCKNKSRNRTDERTNNALSVTDKDFVQRPMAFLASLKRELLSQMQLLNLSCA